MELYRTSQIRLAQKNYDEAQSRNDHDDMNFWVKRLVYLRNTPFGTFQDEQ